MAYPVSLVWATLAGTLLLSGCAETSTLDGAWKSTKSFYSAYLNPPASVNYEDKGSLDEAQTLLASRMIGIDLQLEQLDRFLQNSDRPPSGESVALLFQRFPWLSGLAAVDALGMVLAQEPSYSLKTLDFLPLLEQKAKGENLRGVRGLVQDTPLGPEVMAAVPIYTDTELKGLLITHFDIRSLFKYTSGEDDLVVLSPQGVLWTGRFAFDATPLAGQDWAALTRDNIQGTVSNKNGEFLWIARFIGRQPLVFAVPIRGHFPDAVLDTQPPSETSSPSETTEQSEPEGNTATEGSFYLPVPEGPSSDLFPGSSW